MPKNRKAELMARYPGAKWRPISVNYTRRNSTKNCVILHTSASASATSLHGWFSNKNANASSHFHVDDYGVVEQYIDTDHISWANGEGNPRSVTIETQGDGNGAWTSATITALVKLIKWITGEHGIPVRQMASSKASEKGIGWHRQGIDGNFPKTGILRGRVAGGQKWSSARGKVCPGTKRIQQIPALIEAVKSGDVTPAAPKPTPVKPAPAPSTVKANSGNSAASNRAIAELLNSLGYKAGIADGVPGPYLQAGVKAFQLTANQWGGAKFLGDGDWGPLTQRWFEWVRDELQRNVGLWAASKDLGTLRRDGDYAKLTNQHVAALQRRNPALYKGKVDGIAGAMTCKAFDIKPFVW